MKKALCLTAASVLLVTFFSADLFAAPFYQGKTLRINVGTSPGGGFDLWARVVGRHLGKHIPGNPAVLVENIPGAGHLIMTNQFAKTVKPDGLTIAHINGGLILAQMLGEPGYDFDPQKFIYLGAVNKENAVTVLSKKTGITSVEKWRASKVPVQLGGTAPGNSADNQARLAKIVLGLPAQIVTGYKGTLDCLVAIDSGELDGTPASWDTVRINRRKALETGDLVIVLQLVAKPIKAIAKVPRFYDAATTDEQKKIIEIVSHQFNDYSRPYAAPPGTPMDRVDILRKALKEMTSDKEFLAELEKSQFNLDYTSAEELTAAVAASTKQDAAMKAKLREVLFK